MGFMEKSSKERKRTKASIKFVEKYYADDLAERASPESVWASQWAGYVNGDSVLDVACGPQFYDDALAFAHIPKKFVGIDINEANIEFLRTSSHPNVVEARTRFEKDGTRVELLVDDITIEKPEFRGRFDSVFASGIIGNFDEAGTRAVMRNIHSYLAPGGQFVMVSWGDDYLSKEKSEEKEASGWYQKQELKPEDYGRLISEAGFTIEKKGVHKVADPKAYEWGCIFGFVARKNADEGPSK